MVLGLWSNGTRELWEVLAASTDKPDSCALLLDLFVDLGPPEVTSATVLHCDDTTVTCMHQRQVEYSHEISGSLPVISAIVDMVSGDFGKTLS